MMLAADSVYGTLMQYGLYDGGTIDLGWLLAFTFMGAAFLHPSVTDTCGALDGRAAAADETPPRRACRDDDDRAGALRGDSHETELTLPLVLAISAGAVILFLLVLGPRRRPEPRARASIHEVVRPSRHVTG